MARLEPVSYQSFEWSITTLSQCSTGLPLTVGTSLGIFLHDFRDGSRRHAAPADHSDRVENVFKVLFASDPLPPYASLSQPTPLSILHLPLYGDNSATASNDIYIAGRFPSILHYDRRTFPSIVDSIHSGASLCSLASSPHVFDESTHNSRRRQGLLEYDAIESSRKLGRTIIAAGEYNTKGSLELYSLGQSKTHPGRAGRPSSSATMVNRQTSAYSKIMSVTTQGSRIVTSDASGNIRWFERDGFTHIRSHRIGSSERIDKSSIFYGMPDSNEMARKIISTQSFSRWRQGTGDNFEQGTEADDNGIVFLTDDKLGMLRFSKEPPFLADDFESGAAMTAEEQEEWAYRERMKTVFDTENNALGYSLGLGSTFPM
ncbi:hypothetical protein TD95_005431 [Thielaviopsis punctulata]|uniref:Uncharacterized protein n=1 Tax=Thielaviopsis punctulata TaxID=72032 RepID=A0A0F4ZM68_9PEZI|nr:hypothetical protein TD95_005431 [Thielaviopsis punctulata]